MTKLQSLFVATLRSRMRTPVAILLLTFPAAAGTIELAHDEVTYTINTEHGNLDGAARAGQAFYEAAHDHYRLFTADTESASDESHDVVTEVKIDQEDGEATLVCGNHALGLRIRKHYWIEQDSGLLFKKIEIGADAGVGGELWFESGAAVPAPWWNGGVLWEPVWHTGIAPFRATRDIKEYTNMAPRNGCRSFVALYQPREDACVLHFRWGGEQFEHFDVVGERPDFGKRVWPKRWLLGSQERFVGGPNRRRIVVQMVYGLHPGTAQHALMAYVARPEYRELYIDPLQGMPAWMEDAYIDEHWDTSYLNHGYDTLLKDVVEKKLHFGTIQTILWGAFPHELYIARPEDKEPDSPDDPADNIRQIKRMQGLSPRIKAGYYTHFGSVSAKQGSQLARFGEENGWIAHQRDGRPKTHRTDYNMKDENAAISLTRFEPGFRDWHRARFRQLFEHNGVDLIYMDTSVHPSAYEYDWKEFRSPAARDIIEMYADFQEIAHEFDGAVTMNMPISTGNDAGFAEWGWFPSYQRDWRNLAGRIGLYQAMNAAERRTYFAGFIMPGGNPTDPSIRLHLNCMRMYAMGLGMLDVKPVEYKRDLYVLGAPWIQAGFELRRRGMVNADIAPDWFKDPGTEIEAYAWKMTEGYGLVTVMNHDIDPLTQKIAFTTRPLGLRPGRPAYIWRHEMPNPNDVDYAGVTMESPIRRLASARLLQTVAALPKRVDLDLELPADNPVELAITHSPAVLTAVEGKACQYWLPAAYGAEVSGTVVPGQINVTVDNPREHCDLLIALPEGHAGEPGVEQRRWSESHATGVALGYEKIDFKVEEHGGASFIALRTGKGQTEVVVK